MEKEVYKSLLSSALMNLWCHLPNSSASFCYRHWDAKLKRHLTSKSTEQISTIPVMLDRSRDKYFKTHKCIDKINY